MNPSPTSTAAAPSAGDRSTSACCGGAFDEALKRQLEEMEKCVREAPVQSVLVAAAAGFALNHVPVLPLLRSGVRLAVSLLPSALVVVGAVKLFEALGKPQPAPARAEPRTDSGF